MIRRAAATFAFAALLLAACKDLDPAPAPTCPAPVWSVRPPVTLAPVVPRRAVRAPAVVDPDPLSVAPFARELDAAIACAKPVAGGRRLPTKASGKVQRLHDACGAAIQANPPAEGPPAAGLDACAELAEILDAGYGAPENGLLAVNLEARACALGGMRACRGLASASFGGLGLPFDPACGEAVLGFGCDKGDAESCAHLGERWVRGDLLAQDERRGRELLRRACDASSFQGCLWLSAITPAAAEKLALVELAAAHAETACAAGDGKACSELHWAYRPGGRGSAFGDAFRDAHGDQAKSDAFEKKACDSDLPFVCYGGVERAEGLQKSCDGGNAERCIDLVFAGPYGSGNPLRPDDRRHLEDACRGGSSRGCWALGRGDRAAVVLHDACIEGELGACRPDSRGGPEPGRSDEERKRACDQGSAIDCKELGEAAVKAAQFGEAVKLFERACPSVRSRRDSRDIDATACAEAGRRYRKGEGVAADPARALDLLLIGCFAEGRANRRGEGCADLADMFDKGEGTPKDPDRATAIYAGLCAAQSKQCDAIQARLGSALPPREGW